MEPDRLHSLIVSNEVNTAKAEYVLSQLCPGGYSLTLTVSPSSGDTVFRLQRAMDDEVGIGHTFNGALYKLLANVRARYAR